MSLDMAPLAARLEAVDGLAGRVEVCARAADALAQHRTGPFCWLCELRGESGESQTANRVSQRRRQRFSTLTLVSRAGDASGAQGLAASGLLRAGVSAALLGFVPAPGWSAVVHLRDIIVARQDGKLYWLDEWTADHQLRSL